MNSYGHIIIMGIVGFSSTLVLFVPSWKKRQTRHIALERLKLIGEAIEQAEERAMRVKQRHDQLLAQMCCYYLCHKELQEAVIAARKAVDEELEFVSALKKMQLWVLATFPHHVNLEAALSSFIRD